MKSSLIILLIISSTNLLATTGIGLSSYPLKMKDNAISYEFVGISSQGGGVGFQGRYSTKLTHTTTIDSGLTVAGGDYSSKIFFSYDTEIIPDYHTQPRVSIKTSFENLKYNKNRKNMFSLAPVISKGLSISGYETYPTASIVSTLDLNSNKTYQINFALDFGTNVKIHYANQKMILSFNSSIGLDTAPTKFTLGMSFIL